MSEWTVSKDANTITEWAIESAPYWQGTTGPWKGATLTSASAGTFSSSAVGSGWYMGASAETGGTPAPRTWTWTVSAETVATIERRRRLVEEAFLDEFVRAYRARHP